MGSIARAPVASALFALVLTSGGGFGCSKSGTGSGSPCSHAGCGDHFFVDVIAPVDCESGTLCQMGVKLAALGDFHVNDEYAYRFVADPKPLVQFSGTDPDGQTIFSKSAGDWHKEDAKNGTAVVSFFVSTPGSYTISGTFKLSVCAGANCLMEQRTVSSTFNAR